MDSIWKEILDSKSGEEFEKWLGNKYDFFITEYKTINTETKEVVETETYFTTDGVALPWDIIECLAIKYFDEKNISLVFTVNKKGEYAYNISEKGISGILMSSNKYDLEESLKQGIDSVFRIFEQSR